MHYNSVIPARFVSRPNRFIAHVIVDGCEKIAHVKNTGRCKELLVPGCTVYLEDFAGRMGSRKLQYSLIAVEKVCEDGKIRLINMDSQAPNGVIKEEFVKSGLVFKAETTYRDSRFDFYFEKDGISPLERGYLEVKGCTLENQGHCLFPDAPTVRGVKHINELIDAKKDGYWAGILILIQMEDVKDFAPNDSTHKEFGDALRKAKSEGVEILCYNCKVTPCSLELLDKVPVIL